MSYVGVVDAVEEPVGHRLLAGLAGPRRAGYMPGQAVALHHPEQRRADESEADNRGPSEQRLTDHAPFPERPRCSASAATVARNSSSSPMVMRRQSGRP